MNTQTTDKTQTPAPVHSSDGLACRELEVIIKNQPIDIELCGLLGDKQSDFLVLCFDGEQLDFFGTPYDTPRARVERQDLVDLLNDNTENSLWPKMWVNWEREIRRQFKLDETVKDYRPAVSLKVSRVCHGYSEHLHAAIGLFETLADKIVSWELGKSGDGTVWVKIFTPDFKTYKRKGKKPSLVIVEAVVELLKAKQANDKLRHGGENL